MDGGQGSNAQLPPSTPSPGAPGAGLGGPDADTVAAPAARMVPRVPRVTVSAAKILFDAVVLNETHSLQEVQLANPCDSAVLVQLSSTLAEDALIFQSENENLLLEKQTDANVMFNQINLIEEVEVGPGETVPVVVGFLPTEEMLSAQPTTSRTIPPQEPSLNPQAFDDEPYNRSYRFQQVHGLIKFGVSWAGTVAGPSCTPPPDGDVDDGVTVTAAAAAGGPQAMAIKFMANVCRSIMHVEPSDREVHFEHCVVGRVYDAELPVWNNSEIPLSFELDTTEIGTSGVVQFTHFETGELFTQVLSFFHSPLRALSSHAPKIDLIDRALAPLAADAVAWRCNPAAVARHSFGHSLCRR